MASIRLSRLHSLESGIIDSTVTRKAPGVYALDQSSQGWFTVAFVGRSDGDVNASLQKHVGRYRFFKYAYCSSAREAFEAECDLYHEHHPKDNTSHPDVPEGLKCPRCGFPVSADG